MGSMFNLESGRSVELIRFHFRETYSFIEGRPDVQFNTDLLRNVLSESLPAGFSEPPHLIAPIMDLSDPDHPHLPRYTVFCQLQSDIVSDYTAFFSTLSVVFFANDIGAKTLPQMVSSVVHGIPWDDLAFDGAM